MEALNETLKVHRANGDRVVMCHGVFDPLHAGHILHFKTARAFGDVLIVSVTADRHVNKGPWRPVFNERLRAQTLSEIETVDYVVVNDSPTAINAIKTLRPDVYVKGADYEKASEDLTGQITPETEAVTSVGGRIEFTHDETFSATNVVNQFFSPYPKESQDYLEGLRQQYSPQDIIDRLRGLSGVKPLVVGEVIIDEYCYAEPLAKAPRESIIAAKFRSMESFVGGAAATANHLSGFCDEVTLLATIGPDPAERKLIEEHLAPNVRLVPVITPDRGTVTKRRFLDPSHYTKMFEIQFLKDDDLTEDVEKEAERLLAELLPAHDMTIVNDFGHGFLTDRLRSHIVDNSKFLALNTQTNSANLGFNLITRYSKADYCCIDMAEARLAAGKRRGEVSECGPGLLEKLDARAFMITTGRTGAVQTLANGDVMQTPALSPTVIDRVGAGDAFFAITSPWVFKGEPDDLTGFVGNCVGALQVGIVGNRTPVGPVPLYKFITSLLS